MTYEVENKFPVENIELVIQRLEHLGTQFGETIEQVDTYFAHPARDFAQTDEALRIRRVGATNVVTYKGPKIDVATKTRRELELPLCGGDARAAQYGELLELLGFRRVADVRKRRRAGHLAWGGWKVEVALDQVDRLGRFVELEIVATESELRRAQTGLLELAAQLGLVKTERRSYLELLLTSDETAR